MRQTEMDQLEKGVSRLCVVDLEATCWKDRSRPGPNGRGRIHPVQEIIEIGAVMADRDTLKKTSEFQAFIKPVINPELSPFCKSLTGITQEQVDSAKGYVEVISDFIDWLEPRNSTQMLCWGDWDFHQFDKDCQQHDLVAPFYGGHFNIKRHASQKLNIKQKGVSNMLKHLKMEFDGNPHRGIDDARNTLRILQKVGM